MPKVIPHTNAQSKRGEETYLFPKKKLNGPATVASRRNVLIVHILGAVLGTGLWAFSNNTQHRTFGIGLVFPGAGYLALSRWYLLAFLLNTILLPVSIIGWFIIGIVPLPLGFHYGAALLAARVGRTRPPTGLFSHTPYISWALTFTVIIYYHRKQREAMEKKEERRQSRNAWITSQVAEDEEVFAARATNSTPGQHELSREQLRHLQYLVNLVHQPLNSWEGFKSYDQFRESAYRYQLYNIVYCLSAVQCSVMPNFHGYLSEAQRSALEKALQPAVLYYWALESLWGRGSLNWDPVKNENIMVTGWYLYALMAYTSNTRDMRYTKPSALLFRVTPFHKYAHSIPTLVTALVDNWKRSEYSLYACEPNWVYTICNAYGALGAQIYDRVFGTSHFKDILPGFQRGWEENFIQPDGNIIVFLSSHTGLTVASDSPSTFALTSIFCKSFLPRYSKQIRALFRKEGIKRDSEGEIIGLNMNSSANLDPGNYTMDPNGCFGKSWILTTAKEFGDQELAEFLTKDMDDNVKLSPDGKGGVFAGSVSTLASIAFATAKLVGFNFFHNCISNGPPEYTFQGPLLADVPYPDILVAKAWSTGTDLELVLYDGNGKTTSNIQLKRLKPNEKYRFGEECFTADSNGDATIRATVNGRTKLYIQLEG